VFFAFSACEKPHFSAENSGSWRRFCRFEITFRTNRTP
jgi:hypothetical protein